jgi:hypothetical protein
MTWKYVATMKMRPHLVLDASRVETGSKQTQSFFDACRWNGAIAQHDPGREFLLAARHDQLPCQFTAGRQTLSGPQPPIHNRTPHLATDLTWRGIGLVKYRRIGTSPVPSPFPTLSSPQLQEQASSAPNAGP